MPEGQAHHGAAHPRRSVEGGVKKIAVPERLIVRPHARPRTSVNKDTGEIIASANDEITDELLEKLLEAGVAKIHTIYTNDLDQGPYIAQTLKTDDTPDQLAARVAIYRMMRPGEPPTEDAVEALFHGLFFNEERYDLFAGRADEVQPPRRPQRAASAPGTLTNDDIIAVIKILVELRNGRGEIDDIDHLGNRRVRSVGELAGKPVPLRAWCASSARSSERLGQAESDNLLPHDLINAKPISAAIKEFFGSSQLSQFMDQTNPLSEITHKRRVSALGPGGLDPRARRLRGARRAPDALRPRVPDRDAGRPEHRPDQLAGAVRAHQRIRLPRDAVSQGRRRQGHRRDPLPVGDRRRRVRDRAGQRDDSTRPASSKDELVSCRCKNEFMLSTADKVQFMDVAPAQIVSVAASLIPFLEHDDANRALMGSNMQRQAVPCLRAEKPLVGTGVERTAAVDSGTAVLARRGGKVDYVDANRMVVRVHDTETAAGEVGVDIYNLTKYTRSNQNTNINQRPLVKIGDVIAKGDVIADGASTDMGELALGQNMLVAFMPWNGYNYEDSILISERVVGNDRYTSIHIEELSVVARDTKLGPEEITRDISSLGEAQLNRLDESGHRLHRRRSRGR